MKYLKQFGIIISISLAGEILRFLLPLPVPASIYGLMIMFIGLISGIIPYESVKETGNFLVAIMAVMFIPAGVGLMVSYDIIKPLLIPYMVITIVSTFVVMFVAGTVTQKIMLHKKKKEKL